MSKFRLPIRGQVLLIGASLIIGIVPLVGPLAFGKTQSVSASAVGSSGESYVPVVAKDVDIIAESRRGWKRTPTPTASVRPPTSTPTKTATPVDPPPSDPLPVGQTGTWQLVFRDEFNAGSLDGSKWSAAWDGITGIYGPVNSAETACYDSSNITFPGDGSLHFKFISKQETCKGAVRPYAGALIHSNGKYENAYGYLEVRAYLPASTPGTIANWPAIWSDGQIWPTDGENDTMEGLGGKACYNFHSPTTGTGACANGNYTGWHTFASDWVPGSVTFYYDGVKVGQISNGITASPQYIILDYTQGQWGGPTSVPAEMQIDYVRFWER